MVSFFSRRLQALTLSSTLIDLALVGGKLALGLLTGSLALISDAVHSGLDTAASILAFIAVRTAAQPADREHPYGHGKAENLAAYTEGILLVIAGLIIGYEALQRLGHRGLVDASPIALAFLASTILLEIGRTTLLRQVAKRTGSPSIAALAADKGSDLLSVTAVLFGLIAVRFGFALGDTFAALLVACLILLAAARLIKRSVDVLMDRAVSAAERDVLRLAASIPGVREARSARVRQAGTQLIGEVEITGPPTLPLEAAQGLAERVREAIAADPRTRVRGLRPVGRRPQPLGRARPRRAGPQWLLSGPARCVG
jgi:cation diffusion facilitator family transporter